jgi:hypothetical protein
MPASDSLPVVEGLTSIRSDFGPRETMDRLENEIRSNGMDVFARIGSSGFREQIAHRANLLPRVLFTFRHMGSLERARLSSTMAQFRCIRSLP